MKTFFGIILLIANLVFSQITIGETNSLNNSLEYSSTIDLKRFEQFYVPITATALNDFNSVGISKRNNEKPPLSALRIGGEILSSISCGIGIAYTLLFLRSSITEINYDAYLIALGGYAIGNAIGTYVIGNIGNQSGSFSSAFKGSVGGVLLGMFLNYIFGFSDASLVSSALFPPLLSVYVFNHNRKYDDDNMTPGTITNNYETKNLEIKLEVFNVKF